MTRDAFRKALYEAAIQGRRSLERFFSTHKHFFSFWQREAIVSCWDVGGLAQHVVWEMRSWRLRFWVGVFPPVTERLGSQGSLAGEAVRAFVSPDLLWPRATFKRGQRERVHFDPRTRDTQTRSTPTPYL